MLVLISDISLGLTEKLPRIYPTMKMKRIRKWLRRDTPQQSTDVEAEGEHSDDSSFSWPWTDQADSSIFDTSSLVTEKSEDENTVPLATLRLEDDPLFSAEEDIGVDPYNTGRFDT